MINSIAFSVFLNLLVVTFSQVAFSSTANITDDSNDGVQIPIALAPLSDWKDRSFVGNTDYSIVLDEQQQTSIRAESRANASMLIKSIAVDLEKTPYLQWEWKLEKGFANPNEKVREGDDYPARIYIAIKNKPFSIYPRALNYVWASQSEQFSHWSNPYTDNVIMFAVQTGQENSGRWVKEKRNLKQDLQTLFGNDINSIKGIAIMADTDNTQANAISFFRNIIFTEK